MAVGSWRAAVFGQRGASLIDAVIAVGVFALGMATLGEFLTRQTGRAQSDDLYAIACGIAEEQIETVRTKRFGDVVSASDQITKGNTTYTVDTRFVEETPGRSMKHLAVNVSWDESGRRRNVTLRVFEFDARRRVNFPGGTAPDTQVARIYEDKFSVGHATSIQPTG